MRQDEIEEYDRLMKEYFSKPRYIPANIAKRVRYLSEKKNRRHTVTVHYETPSGRSNSTEIQVFADNKMLAKDKANKKFFNAKRKKYKLVKMTAKAHINNKRTHKFSK